MIYETGFIIFLF